MPTRLRRMLHRAFDIIAFARHAGGEAGWSAMRPAFHGQPVHAVRDAAAAGGMRVLSRHG
jgi:hypothetical protein